MLKKQNKKHNHVINIYSTPKRFISHIQMKGRRIIIFCFNSSNDNNFGKYLAISKYLAVICDLKIVSQLNRSRQVTNFVSIIIQKIYTMLNFIISDMII